MDEEKRIFVLKTGSGENNVSPEKSKVLFVGSLHEVGKFIEILKNKWKCTAYPVNKNSDRYLNKDYLLNLEVNLFSFPLNKPLVDLENLEGYSDENDYLVDRFYLSIPKEVKIFGILTTLLHYERTTDEK